MTDPARPVAAAMPRLRSDLKFEARPGGVFHVQAPEAPQGFLLYELELALARLLDGTRTAEEVLAGAARLGVAATPDSLSKFFRQIQLYGFLQTAEVDRTPRPRTMGPAEAPAARDPVLKLWAERKHEEALTYLEMLIGQHPDDEGLLQLHEMLQRQLLADDTKKPAPTAVAAAAAPAESQPEPEPSAEAEPHDQLLREVIEQGHDAVGRRGRRALVRRLIGVAIAGGVVASMLLVHCADRITEPCELMPKSRAVVRSTLDSIVEKVLVQEGQAVKKGDLLIKLADFEFRKRLDRVDAQLAKAKAERDLLLRGARPAELSRVRQSMAARFREVGLARARMARLQKLVEQQLASVEDFDVAASEVATKEAALADVRSTLSLLIQGPTPEELAKREAEIRGIEVERSLAFPSIAATELRSPIDGVVVTSKLAQKVGSVVTAGATLVEVVDLTTMIAEVYVPQAKVELLGLGAPVRVKVGSLPSELFVGKVTFVGLAVERRGEPPAEYVRAESELDNSKGLLRPQVTGYAEIDAGTFTLGARIFRSFAQWVRFRFVI